MEKIRTSREVSIFTSYFASGKFMQLPLNRIRTLCQKDEDYNLVTKPALVILTRATELFLSDLAGVCGQIAK